MLDLKVFSVMLSVELSKHTTAEVLVDKLQGAKSEEAT